jgi:hypothetical protein
MNIIQRRAPRAASSPRDQGKAAGYRPRRLALPPRADRKMHY